MTSHRASDVPTSNHTSKALFFRLGVDRFPKVDLPTVSVRTDMPGASTEEVETQVSQKIEEAVNTAEGITELRSISGAGRFLKDLRERLENWEGDGG